MLALGFNGPWDLALETRPDPPLGPSDVLIEVIATGICGSDVHGYSGDTGRRHTGQVMGHETVGRVRGAGTDAEAAFTTGELATVNPIISCGHCAPCLEGESQVCAELRVVGVEPTLDGAFAELLVIPARNVVPISENIPVLHGALIEPLAVGYHAVAQGAVTAEDRMLVLGGGPIGQAALIAGRRIGVTSMLVSEPSPERRALLERLGFSTTEPSLLDDSVESRLGGKATVVIDAVGIEASFADALTHSTTRARIVLVGMGTNRMSIEPYRISVSERSIVGSYCYSDDHFRSTAEWVSEGQPQLDLLIESALPLSNGPDIFRAMANGSAPSNKVFLMPAESTDA